MSTKGSIEYIDIETAYIHIYTECFDKTDRVYIEAWEQASGDRKFSCETISIPYELWQRLKESISERAK